MSLKAPNHEIILKINGMYDTRTEAELQIEKVRKHSACEDDYERFISKDNKPSFRLTDGCGDKLGVSETYESTQGRENGLAACMKYGPVAPVFDASDPSIKRLLTAIAVGKNEMLDKVTLHTGKCKDPVPVKPKGGYFGS